MTHTERLLTAYYEVKAIVKDQLMVLWPWELNASAVGYGAFDHDFPHFYVKDSPGTEILGGTFQIMPTHNNSGLKMINSSTDEVIDQGLYNILNKLTARIEHYKLGINNGFPFKILYYSSESPLADLKRENPTPGEYLIVSSQDENDLLVIPLEKIISLVDEDGDAMTINCLDEGGEEIGIDIFPGILYINIPAASNEIPSKIVRVPEVHKESTVYVWDAVTDKKYRAICKGFADNGAILITVNDTRWKTPRGHRKTREYVATWVAENKQWEFEDGFRKKEQTQIE